MKTLLMTGLIALLCREDDAVLIKEEFDALPPDKLYDLIIAKPSFDEEVYIKQVIELFKFLARSGKLITTVPKTWMKGKGSKNIAFKEFVEKNGFFYNFKPLYESTLFGQDDSVVLIITKKG